MKKKKKVKHGKAQTQGLKAKAKKKKRKVKKNALPEKKKKTPKKVKRSSYKSTGKKTGRPTEYNKRFAKIAADVFELGGSNKQVCDLLKISEACFYKWMKDHPDFAKTVIDVKDVVNLDLVKKSNLKRCLGYSYDEQISTHMTSAIKAMILEEEGGNKEKAAKRIASLKKDRDGLIIVRKTKKHMPGDGALIKNYLFNKSDGEFQQRQAVELEAGKTLVDIMAKVMSEDGSI
jgi:hypothetical protein